MNIFKPDPIKANVKQLRKEAEKAFKNTQMAGELKRCEDYFVSVISNESVNIEKRKKLCVGVQHEKARIRDAVIGFLANEELALDMPSLVNDQKIDTALNRMTVILFKMNFMAAGVTGVSFKDLYGEISKELGDNSLPSTLSLRAHKVDMNFIDKLIAGVLNGYSVKPLIHKLLETQEEPVVDNTDPVDVDFTQFLDTPVANQDVMDEFANMR